MTKGRAWSRRDENRLRQVWPAESMSRICELLGRTSSAVKNQATKLGLRRPRQNYHLWTHADRQRLRRCYPHRSTSEVARMMGCSVQSIWGQAAKMKLHKTEAYLASPAACRLRRGGDNVGQAHRFLKGHVPQNKGLRRPGYFRGRMRETWFKKGHHNEGHGVRAERPIGALTVNSDGYLMRKVRMDLRGMQRWRMEHVLIWERERGPVPPGHIITFKDRDRTHVTLDNLECITLADNMRCNSIHARRPPEIKEAIYALIAVKSHITKKEKKRAKEQAVRPAGSSVRNARAAQG